MTRRSQSLLGLLLVICPCQHAFTLPLGLKKQWNPRSATTTVKYSDDGDQCDLEDDGAEACLSVTGMYQPNTSPFMLVSDVYVSQVESLRDRFPSFEGDEHEGFSKNMVKFNKRKLKGHHQFYANSTMEDATEYANEDDVQPPTRNGKGSSSHMANLEYSELIDNDEVVLVDTVRKPGMKSVSRAFPRAGPRRTLHFEPSKVNAAIVTCGGLCPGLNNVIRELVHSLYYLYGAKQVYGITGGFHGFHKKEFKPIKLTNNKVENIHHDGGTVLRSSRGGFDIDKILDFLQEKDISQLYVIGGDGTHRGAYAIHEACLERGLNIAVAGLPKTIDNDCDYIDRSFGFQSAVEAAQAAIRTAKTEAMCNVPNGIGICKLMGRSAGFLAAFAALGSGDVDLVLVPEVPIVLEGPNGILPFLRRRVKEQGYAVVVVAEGAGEELLGVSEETDAGGNRALPEIGPYLQKVAAEYFTRFEEEATIKYVDPSYSVRSVPANAADSLYCQQLAMDAVHGCMAGLTGFSVGVVNKSPVYIPIPQLVATSPRNMDPHGLTWTQILAMTGQPNTAAPKQDKYFKVESDPDQPSAHEEFVTESGMPEVTAH